MEIIWHENKRVYLSIRKEGGRVFLRLHKLFQTAPSPVREAILRYALKGDQKARVLIRQMAHLYFSTVQKDSAPLNPIGTTYNLQEILERLKLQLPIPETAIGWGKRGGKQGRRSITFGTYNRHGRQIRINPLLDDPKVPLYFVEYIVYHEMLHALCPTEMGADGRCSIHTAEFKRRERLFPHYEAAKVWLKKNFKKL